MSSSQESLDDFLKQEQLLLVSIYIIIMCVCCMYVCAVRVCVFLCPLSVNYNMCI